jgi:hypothetical protein
MSGNWASDAKEGILVGIENLPTPIVNHMKRKMHGRPSVKHVYHVTELLYCLRKAYFLRTHSKENIDLEGLWNIYRGTTFDAEWSPLFEENQITYNVEREGMTITGTLDFIWVDEDNLEPVLYDLKMPKNLFYKKKEGAGQHYTEQVQTYLAMAHANDELMDVHRARVLMVSSDSAMIDEVKENDTILETIWNRATLLDEAIETHNHTIITGPMAGWECNEKYCPADINWRVGCKSYPRLV